jgi:hypothetical protein
MRCGPSDSPTARSPRRVRGGHCDPWDTDVEVAAQRSQVITEERRLRAEVRQLARTLRRKTVLDNPRDNRRASSVSKIQVGKR